MSTKEESILHVYIVDWKIERIRSMLYVDVYNYWLGFLTTSFVFELDAKRNYYNTPDIVSDVETFNDYMSRYAGPNYIPGRVEMDPSPFEYKVSPLLL